MLKVGNFFTIFKKGHPVALMKDLQYTQKVMQFSQVAV